MAIITKAIRLETTQQNLIQAVIAKQNDCNSRFLKVTFLNEGTVIPLDPTSHRVTINAERKDGASKSFSDGTSVNEDNTATVPLHSWILELDGIANCDISIFGTDGSKLTTTTFVVKVEKAACSNDDILNDPQYDVLANLLDDVNTSISKATYYKYDFNGDGVVNEDDATHLMHHVSFPDNPDYALSWWSVPDVNGDGVVDQDDATTLLALLNDNVPAAFAAVPKNELIDSTFSVKSKKPVQNKVISQGVANALKGTASGSVVALTDVSPLEHEIGVQLTSKPIYVETVTNLENVTYADAELEERDYIVSDVDYDGANDCDVAWIEDSNIIFFGDDINTDTVSIGDIIRVKITHIEADEENGIEEEWIDEYYLVKQEEVEVSDFDFSSVTLTKYGKNLVDYRKAYPRRSLDTVTIDESIDGLYWTGNYYFVIPASVPAGKTVRFSCKMESVDPSYDSHCDRWDAVYTDGTTQYVGNEYSYTGWLTLKKDLAFIRPHKANVEDVNQVKVWNLQLELGDIVTEYEPFKEPVSYTPNPGGTVEGVTSLYPTTTLLTDTDGVTITAEYNKDANKVIESLVNAIISLGGNV